MTTKAKKYQIIYADPSWYSQFSNNGIIAFQYPMVLKADIGNHNIQSITDKTVAFVWGNQNKKRDTLFFDLGNLTRFNSEICLLEMKGKQKRVSAKILQVILTFIKEHSKKLADACVELFAQMSFPGLYVWEKDVDTSQNNRKEV